MSRPVCARRQADETVKPLLLEVFDANYRVYGRRKMKAARRREHDINLDKDRIAWLMRELGIRGASRSKTTVTTRSEKSSPRAPDLVNRRFRAAIRVSDDVGVTEAISEHSRVFIATVWPLTATEAATIECRQWCDRCRMGACLNVQNRVV